MKGRPAIINYIWLWLVLLAVLCGIGSGRMQAVTEASFDAAKGAVELAIKLIGVMALWLGLMKIAEAGGLMRLIARAIRPVMVRLFPDVPAEHPAMGAMILNLASNMLGLGNAATPMGIKAMIELDRLNPVKGQATNAMCLFLAINTSSVTILPLGVIGVRAAAGASDPASIILPGLIATATSTTIAIIAAKLLAKPMEIPVDWRPTPSAAPADSPPDAVEAQPADADLAAPPGRYGKAALYALGAGLIGTVTYRLMNVAEATKLGDEITQYWIIPLLMMAILVFGYARGVKVYEAATKGAKEGFDVAVRIIPFLVMILVAVAMFKASGGFDFFAAIVSPVTSWFGMPTDVLPVALMRPLSGSGAFGLVSELIQRDPDSLSAYMASIMQGSMETTFYVLAVYFGAVGVTKLRHAVAAGLLADLAGTAMSVIIARLTYPG
ncbi:MAG: spore maturation protein [Myxococcales bacterium]|nr:MAG: spore maturation protein [Myxococcales bacterium]